MVQTNELGEIFPRWEMDTIWNIQGMEEIYRVIKVGLSYWSMNGWMELDTASLGYSTRHRPGQRSTS